MGKENWADLKNLLQAYWMSNHQDAPIIRYVEALRERDKKELLEKMEGVQKLIDSIAWERDSAILDPLIKDVKSIIEKHYD